MTYTKRTEEYLTLKNNMDFTVHSVQRTAIFISLSLVF